MRIGRGLAATAALIGGYAAVVRPRLLRSGATAEEVEGPYPGAELVPGGRRTSTMATTIDAPPRQVWPWLVQMGHDRAGWYSWDRLDNFGSRSAREIHPEWQHISVDDRLLSTPDGMHWFEVAAVEPERFLALRAATGPGGRQLPSSGVRPSTYSDSAWCFLLKELPGGRTRLVVSVYGSARPWLRFALAGFLFWEPAHWIMQRRQFTNLKRRAEREVTSVETQPSATSATA